MKIPVGEENTISFTCLVYVMENLPTRRYSSVNIHTKTSNFTADNSTQSGIRNLFE